MRYTNIHYSTIPTNLCSMKSLLPVSIVAMCLVSSFGVGAESNPLRAWKNQAGKTFTGSFIRSDGASVWIKPGAGSIVKVALSELSAPDQKAVEDLTADFSWKLRAVRWPDQVSAPATKPAAPVSTKRTDSLHEFRTGSFSFLADEPLDPKLVGDFGRVFEASYELMKQLPWEVRPVPADGGQYFRARLMSQRAVFLKAINQIDKPGTILQGVYRPSEGQIFVPFDSLSLKQDRGAWIAGGEYTNDTLRHELAHEMMHDMLPVLPWFIAEGTAEYVRLIPWDGRGGYAVGRTGSSSVMRKIAVENEFDARVVPQLLEHAYQSAADSELAALSAARAHLETFLLGLRASRKAAVQSLKDRLDGKGRKTEPSQPQLTEVRTVSGGSSALSFPAKFDLGQQPEIISKYHAAKLIVYYLQHLDGEGKGTRMLKLMWRLRQWADELPVQTKQFDLAAEKFRSELKSMETKVNERSADENAWRAAMQSFASAYMADHNTPVPAGPEESLLKELPILPSVDKVGAKAMQARWNAIRNEILPESPEQLSRNIIGAFAARKIDLKLSRR
jgi:hypothetical protein